MEGEISKSARASPGPTRARLKALPGNGVDEALGEVGPGMTVGVVWFLSTVIFKAGLVRILWPTESRCVLSKGREGELRGLTAGIAELNFTLFWPAAGINEQLDDETGDDATKPSDLGAGSGGAFGERSMRERPRFERSRELAIRRPNSCQVSSAGQCAVARVRNS